MELKFKRVLLKISGEAFGGEKNSGIDFDKVRKVAELIGKLKDDGAQIAVVNGAGNLFRGGKQGKAIDREAADYIGMVATIMNSLALQETLKERNVPVIVYSAWPIEAVIPGFDAKKAEANFQSGQVVISTAGTGSPFFTTDTAGVQRAIELKCDLMIKASTVDGVYSDDPKVNRAAEKFEHISYDEILAKDLKVLDRSAVEIAREHNLKIVVCEISCENILKVLRGEQIGTQIG